MGVKEELFSFRGLLITFLHDVFALGVIGMLILGVWIWTGQNPIRERATFGTEEDALLYLMDKHPEADVKLIPRKGGK